MPESLQTVDEALAAIYSYAAPLSPVRHDPVAAHGLILAEPISMESDSPPFDRALLDGFAVRSSDAKPAARLEIVGNQDAGGTPWGGEIGPGEALAINTGAVLPRGADAVLMIEHASLDVAPLGGITSGGGGKKRLKIQKNTSS